MASGFDSKTSMRVWQASGRVSAALTYVADDEQPGTPREGYLERVVAAAKHHH